MTKQKRIQEFIKVIMEDISHFEEKRQKFIGLEISSGLIGYLLCKETNNYIFSINKYVADPEVAVLCNIFLEKIELIAELEGETAKVIVSHLLEKTSILGCLQVQNPKRFDPNAKMTGQE